MRSPQVSQVIKDNILAVIPSAEVICLPLADGGEGTVEAVVSATGGKIRRLSVSDPLGRQVDAEYGILGNGKTAILEMAAASGLELLLQDERNPMLTSTKGTGQLVSHLLDEGIRDIIIGIGGSATVDGGAGLAQELGVVFLGDDDKILDFKGGQSLNEIKRVDISKLDSRLSNTRVRVACDVNNPLLGATGAATVYGPQKGASPEMVSLLEQGLANFASRINDARVVSSCDTAGDGAAGGLGFGLRAFCNAEMVSGAGLILDITDFDKHLKGASLVITGEGCTDSQTAHGKLCAVVAEAARVSGVSCILISGALLGDIHELESMFAGCYSISKGSQDLPDAIKFAPENLALMCRSIMKTIEVKL